MENSKKKPVSVIVPVYNAAEYLNDCIKSIIMQSYKDIEIVLVDDGSTDSSLEICRHYQKLDSRIIVIHKKNEGPSSTRNVGLKASKGEFVYFVDADDVIATDAICEMVNASEEFDVDLVMIDYTSDSTELNELTSKEYYTFIEKDNLVHRISLENNVCGYVWNKLFKRSLICEQVFDEEAHMNEDQIFSLRYAFKTKKSVLINRKLYFYRLTQNSAMRCSWNEKKATAFISYLKIANLLKENRYSEYREYANVHAVAIAVCYFSVIKNLNQEKWKGELIHVYRELRNMGGSYYGSWKQIIKSIPFLIVEKIS